MKKNVEHFAAQPSVPGKPLAALALAILVASGCSVQAPEDTAQTDDVELAFASEVQDEQRAVSFNSIAASANFNPLTGQLIIAGQLPRAASIRVEDAATNTLLGVVQAVSPLAATADDDDDDDRRVAAASVATWQLLLNQAQLGVLNVSTVPCTLRLVTPQGTILVPVQAAPGQTLSCAANVNSLLATLDVTRSSWNALTRSLIISGSGAIPRQNVTFLDALTGQVIGVDDANAAGIFRLRLTNVANPPCNVRIVTDTRQVSSTIVGAPLSCLTANNNTNLSNIAPNTVITAPSAQSVVNIGTTVQFDVVGVDPDNNIPMTYKWDFDGAAPNSTLRNPALTFIRAGVYNVKATVTDALGLSDATPDVRTIIVKDPTQVITQNEPNGTILTPSANTTVTVGQAVNFTASGLSPNVGALTYVWNFGGASANVAVQNPGAVIFTRTGVYSVSMTTVDALGLSDRTPDTRIISVIADTGTGTNLAPNGEITQPASDGMSFVTGTPVVFSAHGTDPDSTLPVSYLWDFGSASPASSQPVSTVTFNEPGTYKISLYAVDSLGAVDQTPAVRTVIITGKGTNIPNVLAPESTIISPAQDMAINIGQSVNFVGTGSETVPGSTLIYNWDFDGGSINTSVQNPGAVTFSRAGTYRVRFAARNSSGRVDLTPAERTITVTDPAQTVVAPTGQITSPASDQTLQVGQSLQFAATATGQSSSTTFTYEWDFGGAAQNNLIQNPGTITFNQAGRYRVTLRAKDAQGFADPTPEVRLITVNATPTSNQAPESVITSPAMDLTINMGDSLNLVGLGLDPENAPVNYQWSVINQSPVSGTIGASPSILAPIKANAGVVSFANAGTYKISLLVTDNLGLVDPVPEVRTITVRDVSAANTPPNSQILTPSASGPVNVTVGQTLVFTGMSSEAGQPAAATLYWDFDGAISDIIRNSNNASTGILSFNRPGTYTVALRATDTLGASDATPDTRILVVKPVGIQSAVAPEGNIVAPTSDMQISLGQSLNFSATGTDADNNVPLSYHWNFDGAAPASNAQDAGSVTFTKPGVYNVAMTVTDSTGVSDVTPVMRKVTVLGASQAPGSGQTGGSTTVNAPSATILSPATNQTITAGQTLTFQATAIDASGSAALSYYWTFGGSGIPQTSQQNPGVLTFSVPGVYTVTLNVSNSQGVTDPTPETRIITVLAAGTQGATGGTAPDGLIMVPLTNQIITAGDTVHFMGLVMTPTAGQTMKYVWNFMGGAANVTELSPGDVVFNTPGTYQVSFTVVDAQGVSDLTPSMRTITVNSKP